MLFGPPAPPNIPTLRLGLDRVGAATVQQVQRYAGRGAGDVNRLCQCTHRKLLLIAERTPCSFRVLSLEITTDTISTGCCWSFEATIMGPIPTLLLKPHFPSCSMPHELLLSR